MTAGIEPLNKGHPLIPGQVLNTLNDYLIQNLDRVQTPHFTHTCSFIPTGCSHSRSHLYDKNLMPYLKATYAVCHRQSPPTQKPKSLCWHGNSPTNDSAQPGYSLETDHTEQGKKQENVTTNLLTSFNRTSATLFKHIECTLYCLWINNIIQDKDAIVQVRHVYMCRNSWKVCQLSANL